MLSGQRPFYWALAVSILGHAMVLVGGVPLYLFTNRRATSAMEVTYVAPRVVAATSRASLPKAVSPRRLSRVPAMTPPDARADRPSTGTRDVASRLLPLPQKPVMAATIAKPPRAASAKPIDLDIVPATSPALAKEPTFQLYYRSIRERIRARAYQVVPKPFQQGEVFLSFVIARSGELTVLRLDEGQSSPNAALRQAALRAVREAAPFAPFPPVVTQAQIAFTIVISFEEEPTR